jgi:uncharacterized cofD-like protein
MRKNIVIIGGGTGTFTLLSGLKKYPVNLSVVVSTADDGGSTGRLRRELGVMPTGDIRQCLLGLSDTNQEIKDLFAYRFEQGPLKGHVAGNIIIAALEKLTGNIQLAIERLSKVLKVKGSIYPATLKPTTLSAILENGKVIRGEHNIDEPKANLKPASARAGRDGFKIKNLKLEPSLPANPKAIGAILSADVIVFGPGDLYTSILPNILPTGMAEAVKKSKAKKVLVANIMTKFGQTDGFLASDFVKELQKYLDKAKLDLVIVNNQKPRPKWLKAYKREKAEFVEPDAGVIEKLKIKVKAAALVAEFVFKRNNSDKLKRSFLRHDPDKLAKLIRQIL